MDQLWAPWRIAYVSAPKTPGAVEECFLCRAAGEPDEADDRANLVAGRTPLGVVVLNRFPYNNGHLLVAPRRHVGDFGALTAEELLDAMQAVGAVLRVLQELMRPDGFNVGLNLGKAAGAGLPGHLHWHVVPRWNGDTNFMSVVTDVRVIVQSLESLYDLLRPRLAPLADGAVSGEPRRGG